MRTNVFINKKKTHLTLVLIDNSSWMMRIKCDKMNM